MYMTRSIDKNNLWVKCSKCDKYLDNCFSELFWRVINTGTMNNNINCKNNVLFPSRKVHPRAMPSVNKPWNHILPCRKAMWANVRWLLADVIRRGDCRCPFNSDKCDSPREISCLSLWATSGEIKANPQCEEERRRSHQRHYKSCNRMHWPATEWLVVKFTTVLRYRMQNIASLYFTLSIILR